MAQSATRFKRPVQKATEPRVKREMRSVLCHSLVVDSTFKQSENVTIAVVSLSTCIKGCGLRSNKFKVRTAT